MIIAASSRLEAQATGDSAGVRAAALDYVEGFYEGDSTRLVRSVRPEVSKVGFSRNASTGAYARSAMPWAEFHAYANGIKSGKYRTPANAPKEYFIPVGRFDEFIPPMRSIFQRHHVNVINVSIRHARPDTATLLSWAPREVFAFVVYYKQKTDTESQRAVGVWTRELIDAALDLGGSYYLPYQLHATNAQFLRAYPRAPQFFALKQRLDPTHKFSNLLWAKQRDALPANQRRGQGSSAG